MFDSETVFEIKPEGYTFIQDNFCIFGIMEFAQTVKKFEQSKESMPLKRVKQHKVQKKGAYLLGGVFLRNFYTVFNWDKKAIEFGVNADSGGVASIRSAEKAFKSKGKENEGLKNIKIESKAKGKEKKEKTSSKTPAQEKSDQSILEKIDNSVKEVKNDIKKEAIEMAKKSNKLATLQNTLKSLTQSKKELTKEKTGGKESSGSTDKQSLADSSKSVPVKELPKKTADVKTGHHESSQATLRQMKKLNNLLNKQEKVEKKLQAKMII